MTYIESLVKTWLQVPIYPPRSKVSSSDWAFFILEPGKLSMRIYLHTQKNSKLKQSNSLLKKFKALPVLEYIPWLEQ